MMADTNVAAVEQLVRDHLRNVYNIDGEVATVMNGVNWTLKLCASDNTDFYVRLYRLRGRPAPAVAAEMAVLNAVETTDSMSISRPVKTVSGDWSSELVLPPYGLARTVGVFRSANGIEPVGTLEDYRLVGRALSDLHRQKKLSSIAPQRRPGPGAGVPRISERSSVLANAILAATTSLEAQGAHTQLGSVGFCHGDIRLSNLRVSGEQVVFFDFDDCGIAHQLLDVAAMAFWLEVGDQKNPQDLWRAFLEGYGVQSSSSTNLAIQWLVLEHQVRAFQWLIDYCALTDELWQKVTEDAILFVEVAKSGTLKVLQT